jgi:hypothetical protein
MESPAMKMWPRTLPSQIIGFVAAVLCDGMLAQQAFAATYVSIDIPNVDVFPHAVSKSGVVAGTAYSRGGTYVGFVRKLDGTMETVSVPGSVDTEIYDINDNGQIVGNYLMPGNKIHGYLRSPDGTMVTIDPLGSTWATACCINSRGTMVGTSSVGDFMRTKNGKYTIFQGMAYFCGINDAGGAAGFDGSQLGFVRAPDGTITQFDLPLTAQMTVLPSCLDAQGNTVGTYANDVGTHGFVRKTDGSIITVDVPGASDTYIASIDVHGTVIGTSYSVPGGSKQFLYEADGSVQMLHIPWSPITYDTGHLRNRDHIVGSYLGADHVEHGYLRTR